jgi:hypothetical protein
MLNQPGTYALANNIADSLTIESDNIVLSLNGYRITGNAEDGYGILIDGRKHVGIYNGTIGPDIAGTVTAGIKIRDSEDVTLCYCNLINLQHGIDAQNSSNIYAQNCRSQFFTDFGFSFSGCRASSLQNCAAVRCTTTAAATGFNCSYGISDIFDTCLAQDLIATNTAMGFHLSNCQKCVLENCKVDTVSSGTAAYGIFLEDFASG